MGVPECHVGVPAVIGMLSILMKAFPSTRPSRALRAAYLIDRKPIRALSRHSRSISEGI
jgi:hypothetical protein